MISQDESLSSDSSDSVSICTPSPKKAKERAGGRLSQFIPQKIPIPKRGSQVCDSKNML